MKTGLSSGSRAFASIVNATLLLLGPVGTYLMWAALICATVAWNDASVPHAPGPSRFVAAGAPGV
jgi:hypothetical protein